ncbi:SAM-dependent methyltransferase [Hamadaea flava]|uniref:Methyltransferase n=1 Tax=Hamadaea flava TaxID=1742688 RepID=A0ABV8LNX7_9ACTN|nr:methyltransferase [Hamadaea flava]MCP2322939.1 SAM-dependent methyltransferase [Hamadaea flava]
MTEMSPRALMSLLFNGAKAVDVLETALELGLLDELEPGPVRLADLAERHGLKPLRLYKFLDCLESLGMLRREDHGDDLADTEYRAVPGLRDAVVAALGPDAIERDRDTYPWRVLHGRLADSLRGEVGMTEDDFAWPPQTDEQTASFESSMSLGLGPVLEVFHRYADRLWDGRRRFLDVGGGAGTLAASVVADAPHVHADVYNLAAVGPLVEQTRTRCADPARLGFVAGDFFAEPLPGGYDTMAFVRVLHDWPADVARRLVESAYAALELGGRLVICEEFRTPDRLAMQFFWSYFLIGVDSCVSRLRDVSFYTELLEKTGFDHVEVLPSAWELVVARKPG